MATVKKSYILKLNIRDIKKDSVPTYMDQIENRFGPEKNALIIVPVTEGDTLLKVVYQITDNNGNIRITDLEI